MSKAQTKNRIRSQVQRRIEDPPVTEWYKTVSVFLAGVLISLLGSTALIPKHVVTQEDLEKMMPGLIAQYSPYTTDSKNIANQIQAVQTQQSTMQQQIQQIQIDVSNISARVGVTANPGGRR